MTKQKMLRMAEEELGSALKAECDAWVAMFLAKQENVLSVETPQDEDEVLVSKMCNDAMQRLQIARMRLDIERMH